MIQFLARIGFSPWRPSGRHRSAKVGAGRRSSQGSTRRSGTRVAQAKASDDQALIAHQQLRIEKLTRQLYGPRSERASRILDQIELQLEVLESSVTEDEIAAEMSLVLCGAQLRGIQKPRALSRDRKADTAAAAGHKNVGQRCGLSGAPACQWRRPRGSVRI
jgi:hypothetical protein